MAHCYRERQYEDIVKLSVYPEEAVKAKHVRS